MQDIRNERDNQTQQDAVDIDKLLEEVDHESRFRKYAGPMAMVITVIAIAMSVFQLYTAGFGLLESIKQRSIHLFFLTVLVFLLYPSGRKTSGRKMPTVFDFLFMILGAVPPLYLFFRIDQINLGGGLLDTADYAIGAIGIIVLFEAARRVLGMGLTTIAFVFLIYILFGHYIPGTFGHREFSLERIIEHLYFTPEGIFGIPLGVSATYIFLFVLFGAVLNATKMTQFINDFALSLAGGTPGGPAKVAVIASGFMGMITGSSVANAASIGSFTIPLMKKYGYRPHFAGAVEAVASTGGQIMPPIMGAAAFIMAEFLNIPYSRVMMAAIIPAFLYYFACWVIIHLEAKKNGLKGLSRNELPNLKKVIVDGGHLIIPVVILVYLLVSGVTPLYAAVWGIFSAVIISFLRKRTAIGLKGILNALEMGARGAISVGIACAIVGVVIGSISLSSLGLVVGNSIISLGGNSLILTMFLTMITCLVMGMGVPTTPMYIIVATVAAPILSHNFNVIPLAAHMFVFYYGALAEITPPVALAAFTAAGIARAKPFNVALTACRLALAGFIIPYFYVYNPILLLEGHNYLEMIWAALTATLGVVCLSVGLQNWMFGKTNLIQRIAMFVAAILLITPGLTTDIMGGILLIAVVVWQKMSQKTNNNLPNNSQMAQ
ncbi:TRAP transporter permease [Effusibacillus dendaii]|uniref:C4-dicarboxylate ABC transporter n=1 Tax=Effusibacillus dendaii TaxID=2743772 RepID=A0A7I8DBI7_9BACL|nr:TRAP transporter permease [Effusibacillus dendaii]BCJ87553.1 C4-dicarboxylate ABC transporter [Effusibacillus dendaii]